MQSNILDDVVAYVFSGAHGDKNVHNAVTNKLKGLGARINARLGKEVTHIIFQRKHNATPEEVAAEDGELRTLFEKANKVGPQTPAAACSQHQCQSAGTLKLIPSVLAVRTASARGYPVVGAKLYAERQESYGNEY